MTRIKFQADADIDLAIVKGVVRRYPEIDFQTATAAGLEGVKDANVLLLSSKQQRVLVTNDRRTMPIEFGMFIESSRSSGVLVVSKKLPMKIVIEELILIWSTSTAEEWIDQIADIPI